MKNLRISSLFLFAAFFVLVGFSACDKSDNSGITPVPSNMLTASDQEALQFMREEEKLARDVYTYFNDKYGLQIFGNIASSEQTHMNEVLVLMEKYGVEDPASEEMGIFTNASLQQLYNDLIALGNNSIVDALIVGATIEDVDIRDLRDAIDETIRIDFIAVYDKLECGSRNHMRAFTNQLEMRGETYTPQFISQEMFDAIINGEHEQCGW